MQLQKDVLIAGGVVVVCVALVVVALVATGSKKDAGGDQMAAAPTDSYGSGTSAYGDPGSSHGGNSMDGGFAPAPGGDGGFTPVDGGSVFAPAQPSPIIGYGGYGHADPTFGGPPISAVPDPTLAPIAAPAGGGTHTVAKGETLGDISAAHYGTTKHWRKIVEANPGLDPARLKIGQVIQIPAVDTAPTTTAVSGGPDTYTVKKGESYYTIAKKELGSASRWRELERLNNTPAEELRAGAVIKLPAKNVGGGSPGVSGPASAGGKTHVVSKGETLGDISKVYYGTTTKWKEIVEANPGVRPENLKVGQSLVIPDAPASSTTGGTAAPIGGNTYAVKSGDTLESIAASILGKKSAWKQIVEVNPGLEPTSLRIGQVLAIPGGSPSAPAFAPAPVTGGQSPLSGSPAPAPAPTFQDDPFYSPYDAQPAPAPVR